jgi:hypothetical protein
VVTDSAGFELMPQETEDLANSWAWRWYWHNEKEGDQIRIFFKDGAIIKIYDYRGQWKFEDTAPGQLKK